MCTGMAGRAMPAVGASVFWPHVHRDLFPCAWGQESSEAATAGKDFEKDFEGF